MLGHGMVNLMDGRLKYLVLEAWEHDHPPGPETDLNIQDREREGWIETLTAEDCLAMAYWLTNPVVPDEWGVGAHWHWQLAYGLTYYVGKAGRRYRDARLENVVVAMIRQPATRHLGFACAQELCSPALFGTLLCCLDDRSHGCDLCLALVSSTTDEQVGHLSALAVSAPTAGLRKAAAEVIVELLMLHREQGVELDEVSDDGKAPPDPSAVTAWRSTTAVMLARQIEASRDFSAMPLLADALQEAGCDNQATLLHCRDPGPHVCGCWVVSMVLGKE